jgi:hypothetical protein
MTEVQGRGTGALNIERIYSTTVSAEELAKTLADHFRAQEFEAQVYRTSENRTVMQARKESLWRQLLGVTYALTVVFAPGEGRLSISLGGHEWVDAAVSGQSGWSRSRRCCWEPRTASGRRTSWTRKSGR